MQQRHSAELSNPQDPLLSMNQTPMDRIQSMQPSNGQSPNHYQNSTSSSSTPNWSDNPVNIANNLMNNSTEKSNPYEHFANYNSFAQQHMNLILNQNGKHSPNQSLMQHQAQLSELGAINGYNGQDFPPLLQ